MLAEIRKLPVVFDSSATSNAVSVGNYTIVGLEIGSGFNGTAITIDAASTEGGTYYSVYDTAGAELSLTVAASRHIAISPITVPGARFVKLTSGASEDMTINLLARPIQ